ncbi:hypothetical protein [Thetidibacter halocola]|uniref:Uncharacterized protein n=1 Tax=Thetidibacter halocola TaxID=2827239 RepID=A0A8J7WH12_9RHOB|nr:hypothetical protein [Thetidibacter halocola]MBS0125171.1 hypothetical protein [Thetidibacter halocola]
MQVLLLDRNGDRLDRGMIGFMEAGVLTTGTGSVSVAEACLRRTCVDLLVITADSAGAQTRALIHLAEQRNPDVATILMAADVARATDIAAQSLPSVHCILSADSSAQQVLRFGLASLRGGRIVADRVPQPEPEPELWEEAMMPVEPAPVAPPVEAESVTPAMAEHPAEPATPVFATARRRGRLPPTAFAA